MFRSPLLVLLLPLGALFAQTRKEIVVPAELQQPIEQLKAAIESRLPSKMTAVYRCYEQDDETKPYLSAILDKADSVLVKPIQFQSSNVTRNVAQVNYRMIISVTANQAKTPPPEVSSSWRADLVRDGPKQPWRIQWLTRLSVNGVRHYGLPKVCREASPNPATKHGG